MDSEVIVNLIARSKAETQEERIADAARQIEGAFSLVITTNDSLVGVRDPQGYKSRVYSSHRSRRNGNYR